MMEIIRTIYIIILCYFLLGAIGFYFINRNKKKTVARKSWTKYIVYFFIIHILFFSIVIDPFIFRLLAIFIAVAGFYELARLFKNSGNEQTGFFVFSLIYFGIFCFGFIQFSRMPKGVILFAFLVLSIFDSFSQITGQIWGKRKILPKISSQKTLEGLSGGVVVAMFSVFLLNDLIQKPGSTAFFLAFGIVLFAFVGDISSSFYKRKYNVKDYSNMIPGHGGFLDRFDSLIAGGAIAALAGTCIKF